MTYTAHLTNSGASLSLTGTYRARATGHDTATVAAYFDYVAYHSRSQHRLVPLAGFAAAQSGYTARVSAPVTTGLMLSANGIRASGVTYRSSGDALLGTSIAREATPERARAHTDAQA